jgi:hypothetical protein
MGVTSWYFSGVFKRLTVSQKNALMREDWLRTKESGRARFIRGQMLYSFVFWLILMLGLDVFGDRSTYWSVRSMIFADLVVLPICLLGGYLEGRWKWTDFQRKYPEGSLPPWE